MDSSHNGNRKYIPTICSAILLLHVGCDSLSTKKTSPSQDAVLLRFDSSNQSQCLLPLTANHPELEALKHARKLILSSAYLPGEKLGLLPASPQIEILLVENMHEACSETCYRYESGQPPDKPELLWTGDDMRFLHNYPNLRVLDLRAVWLGKGVLEVIGGLELLEELSLNRCDFVADELPNLTRLKKLRVLKFYWTYLTSGKQTDPSWIKDLASLEEIHLIGCNDKSAILSLANSLPVHCQLVVEADQLKRLPATPCLIAKPDGELDTPKGY